MVVSAIMSRQEARKELRLPSRGTVNEKELTKAYRTRSLETHPDKGGSNEAFVRVAEAYDVLSSSSSDSGSGSGSGSDWSGGEDQAGGFASEFAFGKAEDMFFDMFDEWFTADAADNFIDKQFETYLKQDSNHQSLRLLKQALKMAASFIIPKVMNFLQDDKSVINIDINGQKQTLSGKDFKAWKERCERRRKKAGRPKSGRTSSNTDL